MKHFIEYQIFYTEIVSPSIIDAGAWTITSEDGLTVEEIQLAKDTIVTRFIDKRLELASTRYRMYVQFVSVTPVND